MRSITRSGAAVVALSFLVGACTADAAPRSTPREIPPVDDTPIAPPPEPQPTGGGPSGDAAELAPRAGIDWKSVPGVSIERDAFVDIRTGQVTALPASIASMPDVGGYAVAPGGDVLLFQASPGGSKSNQIFVANVDGTNLRQLTDAPGFGAFAGGWSPDGTKIVAVLDRAAGRGDADLVLIDVATGETTVLASDPGGDFDSPQFSSDGRMILFSRFQKYYELEAPYPEDEGSDVYAIPVGGGEATLLFEDRWNATFSPDGRAIVYERMVAVGNVGGMEVWLADADGSDRRPLVPNDGPFSDIPSWSPDGTRIVFTKHPGDGNVVAVVDVASGTPTFGIRAPGSLIGVWLDDHTLLIEVG